MIYLTKFGKQEVNTYIREAEAKRKEILDAQKDTADDTQLPKEDDILMDIEYFEEDGEYCNGWGVTDHYDTDYPLYLKRGVHYNDEDEKIIKAKQCLVDNGIEEDEAGVVLQALCYILLDEEIEEV